MRRKHGFIDLGSASKRNQLKRDLSQATRLALFLLAVGQAHEALVRWVWG